MADRRGDAPRLIAPIGSTNHPLPSSGERVAWSPDGRSLAYVSATEGPETDNANGDPMVITRYLFKPTAAEGLTRFNDNKRLHIFVVDVASRAARQLTNGASLRTLDQLVAEGRSDSVRLEPRSQRRQGVQLRHLHGHLPRRHRQAADQHQERRIRAGVVAGRHPDRVLGHDARAHLLRDDQGGHARVGDARGRVGQDRSRPVDRQPSGAAAVVARRAAALLHPAGARQRPARVAAGTARPAGRGRRGAGLVAGPRCRRPRRRWSSIGPAVSAPSRWSTGKLAYAFASPDSPAELFVMDQRRQRHGKRGRHAVDHAQQGAARRPSDCPGRSDQLHQRGLHRGSVPHPSRHGRHREAGHGAADRDDSRRAARAAGSRVQPQGTGVCRSRLGVADGQLPRFDRLRAEVRGRDLP